MMGGFLFSFALGFLMTAVPKFTGAAPCKRWELQLATALSLFSFIGSFLSVAAFLVLAFLCFFFFSRYRTRTHTPPKHFAFVPLGLGFGLIGSVLMMLGNGVGRTFLFQGTMLALVLGVGGKLVTALLGWSDSPLVQITSLHSKSRSKFPTDIVVPLTLLVLGFCLEFTPFTVAARILRALSASWIGVTAWKVYRFPRIKTRLARWLWVSCWGLIAGVWLYALSPTLGFHALHLMFMSGFGLMTIVIASRVTLAHGGYDLEIESKSKALLWSSIFIVLAAVTRVSAPLTPSYTHHLGYAATVWIIAMLIWSVSFVPRIARL
jgi:uncharacterized protein involved in response to NO